MLSAAELQRACQTIRANMADVIPALPLEALLTALANARTSEEAQVSLQHLSRLLRQYPDDRFIVARAQLNILAEALSDDPPALP